jgi:hypothetical protein
LNTAARNNPSSVNPLYSISASTSGSTHVAFGPLRCSSLHGGSILLWDQPAHLGLGLDLFDIAAEKLGDLLD